MHFLIPIHHKHTLCLSKSNEALASLHCYQKKLKLKTLHLSSILLQYTTVPPASTSTIDYELYMNYFHIQALHDCFCYINKGSSIINIFWNISKKYIYSTYLYSFDVFLNRWRARDLDSIIINSMLIIKIIILYKCKNKKNVSHNTILEAEKKPFETNFQFYFFTLSFRL